VSFADRALDQRLVTGGEPGKRLTARAIDVRGSLEPHQP